MSLAVTMAVTGLTTSEIPIALQSLAGIIREPSAHRVKRTSPGDVMFPGLARFEGVAVQGRPVAVAWGSHRAR